jgi:hypothetical protein
LQDLQDIEVAPSQGATLTRKIPKIGRSASSIGDQALEEERVADAKRCFIRFRSAARNPAPTNSEERCQLLQQVGDPIERKAARP